LAFQGLAFQAWRLGLGVEDVTCSDLILRL
jgi:hypothetical protein